MNPRVSVILPVYNGIEHVEAALHSIWQQAPDGIQLIVVDDGSDDGTAELLARHAARLTLLRQSNQGPPAARNAGLDAATGRFVGFIDADELWTGGRLARQLGYLQAHPEVDLVQEAIQHTRFDGTAWVPEGEMFHAMSLSSALFRRELFDTVGRLDEHMLYCDDVDWFMRAERAGVRMAREKVLGLLYKKHDSNLTRHRDRVQHYTLRALLKHRRAVASGAGE